MRTLGSLDLRTRDGEELRSALAQGKRMALLCYLAVARPRGFHRRDTLVGLFWPEVDQRRARAALRQALHFVRQSLGPDIVLSRGPEEVGLDFASLACDAIRFEEALERGDVETAAGLYGGPLLHGLYVSDAPEFEKWLSFERDRLAGNYADALRSLAGAAAERGDLPGAARWWKRLAAHDPYSPEIVCRLMAALANAGDRAAAIEHARVYADTIRSNLEIEPDAAVLEYAARLRVEPSRPPVPPFVEPLPPGPRPPAVPADVPHAAPNRPQARRRALWYGFGGALAVLVLLAMYAFLPREDAALAPSRVIVGVLPFENLGSPDDDYFIAGLTEDIVYRLGGVRSLSVVGPNDGRFDTPDNPGGYDEAALGAEYTVHAAVELRRNAGAPQSIRVSLSLLHPADGVQISSETFEDNIAGLFQLQGLLAEEVPRALGIHLLSTEREWLRAQPTLDLQAYDRYLRASEYLRGDASNAGNVRTAVELFENAVSLDTGFVRAHAKLAIAHTAMYLWNHDRSPGRLVAARAAADRALHLRADAPMGHLALGLYYYWGIHNYDRAVRHLELARTTWPAVSDVLVLVGAIRRRQGDLDQALTNHREALAANPSCATCAAELAATYLMLRDFDAAEREAARAMGLAPALSYPRLVGALACISARQDTEAARQTLPALMRAQELVQLAAGRWGAIPRILGGEYDEMLERAVLTSDIADTAGYYLAKAELASRKSEVPQARGYFESARAVLKSQVSAQPDDALLRGRLGLAYAGLGRRHEAIHEGVEATRLLPVADDVVDGTVACEMLARIYAMLGEPDAAIGKLEMLLSGPSLLSKQILRLDPVWAPLAGHPRFQRLIR